MANGIRTGNLRGLDKGRSSKFREGSRVRQTHEEGRRTYRPKRYGNNNKDEDKSPKTLNDKNHQASSQKFKQLKENQSNNQNWFPRQVHPAKWTYVVNSISFQTFFVWAFKIVVDSWKFSILLLYILWDDWPIFISGSNQQLQQQSEYTLTKAWLSQLVNFKNAIWTWGHFRRTICNKFLF